MTSQSKAGDHLLWIGEDGTVTLGRDVTVELSDDGCKLSSPHVPSWMMFERKAVASTQLWTVNLYDEIARLLP